MSDNIPFEIQVEIIIKLPVKSLIQFRCVSKTWKSLIDSFDFIIRYSRQHTQLKKYDEDDDKSVSIAANDDTNTQQEVVSQNVPLIVSMLYSSRIIGSSHGLVCLYSGYFRCHDGRIIGVNMAVLWNISIRKAVAVVVPNVGCGIYDSVIGFGVCGENADPKIVKITYINSWNYGKSIACIPSQVEVFSLRTQAWRSSYSNLPRTSIRFGYFSIVVDGFLYWLGDNMDGGYEYNNLIISFDITIEEFLEVKLPESLAQQPDSNLSIFKLKESLVVLEGKEDEMLFVVWMMKDHVSKLFEKLFIIDVNTPGASVRGFKKNGKPIVENLEDDSYRELVVYEPNSKHIYNIVLDGRRCSCIVYPYMETLLLHDQPNFTVYDQKETLKRHAHLFHKQLNIR